MRLLLRCVIAVCVCLLAMTPAWAQNSGGLPGKEHTLAKAAYERAERVVLLEDAAQGDVVPLPVRRPGRLGTIRRDQD